MASTMTISSARETLMLACDFQRTVFFFQQPKYEMYYNILMIIYVSTYRNFKQTSNDSRQYPYPPIKQQIVL